MEIAVEVIDRKCALIDVDAIFLRLLAIPATIARRDVKLVNVKIELRRSTACDDRNFAQ